MMIRYKIVLLNVLNLAIVIELYEPVSQPASHPTSYAVNAVVPDLCSKSFRPQRDVLYIVNAFDPRVM